MSDSANTLTPQEAAKYAKCGRSSVMRALADKHLPGVRDNAGKWHIKIADLNRWMGNRPVTNQRPDDQRPVTDHSLSGQGPVSRPVTTLDRPNNAVDEQAKLLQEERDKALLEVVVLRAEAAQLRERLSESQNHFRERLDENRRHLDEVQVDRDHWRQLVKTLSESKSSSRRTFLDRLLGRN